MSSPECVICTDSPRLDSLIKLDCGHHHCHACLAFHLDMCLKSAHFQPARCCNVIGPATFRVARTVQPARVRQYRSRLEEYETKNKLYCHAPACAAFIPTALRFRRSALCRRCLAKTCSMCGAKAHFSRCTAPLLPWAADSSEEQLLQLARDMGWKRCPGCHLMVSKSSGCNHMRCRCGCDFCYRCGRTPYSNHGACAM